MEVPVEFLNVGGIPEENSEEVSYLIYLCVLI